MGTATGTRALRTGDLVRVDGTSGLVEVIERTCTGGAALGREPSSGLHLPSFFIYTYI